MGMGKRVIERSIEFEEMTLDEAFKEYILEKQALNLAPKSIQNYELAYFIFRRDMGVTEYVYCCDIDIKVIQSWIAQLKKRVKVESINSYITAIRAFLYWCMDDERGYIKDKFKIQKLRKQEEAPKHYTDEEIAAILEKPKKSATYGEWRTWAVVNFILGTGARASTVCNAKIENVDFVNKEICYEHTKNNKSLVIPLSPTLENVLKEYIRIWRRTAKPDELLFPTISNTPFTAKTLWYSTRRFFKNRGIEKTSVHGLRHTFAIGWVRNRGNVFVLQKILGHSTLEMTRKYVKLYGDDLKTDFELYSPLDNIKRANSKKPVIKRSS